MARTGLRIVAALALSGTVSLPAHGQAVPGGWRHARVLTSADDCDACHISHLRTSGGRTLRGDRGGGGIQSWLMIQAPGAGEASIACLRCHWTSQARAKNSEFALERLSGGRFVGPDLADDHPLGTTDPTTPRLRDGLTSGTNRSLTMSDRDAIDCTTCHDPHTASAAVPSGVAQGRLCGSCHPAQAGSLDQHRAVVCTGCHEMHDARQAPFLRETTLELMCTRCHAGTGGLRASRWWDKRADDEIPVTLSPSHNPGSNCQECHTIHRVR